MARWAKCGKSAGIPSSIHDDMRTGTRTVNSSADLAGAKPKLQDQCGMKLSN